MLLTSYLILLMIEIEFAIRRSDHTSQALTCYESYSSLLIRTGLVRLCLVWKLLLVPGPFREDPSVLCASLLGSHQSGQRDDQDDPGKDGKAMITTQGLACSGRSGYSHTNDTTALCK